jgi:RNA polymerase sigma-70 factor (ECF subfamily)
VEEASLQEEFSRFFDRTKAGLLGQAYLLVGNPEDAQDLVQEVYLRVWRNWDRVSSLDNSVAWSRSVLHNLAIGRWRRLKIQRSRSHLNSRATVATPEVSADHLDLISALMSLPTIQRRVLVLRAFDGLSTADIAAEIGTSEATVRLWLSRARASIAANLRMKSAPPSRKVR